MNPVQILLIYTARLYQWTLSPLQKILFGPHAGCRFTPTCSEYALEAIRTRGAMVGSWLAFKRLCRCHPWGDCGHDPVPPARSAASGQCDVRTHDTGLVAAPQTQNH